MVKAFARVNSTVESGNPTQAESRPPQTLPGVRAGRAVLIGLYLGLSLILAWLAYRVWLDPAHGLRKLAHLQSVVAAQQLVNDQRTARNRALAHDVSSFKAGTDAVEERARSELGMIRSGETFVRLIEPDER